MLSVAGPTGEVIDTSRWQLNNGNQIWFLQPQDWWWPGGYWDIAAPPPWFNMSWYGSWNPQAARDITVDYIYGSPPPIANLRHDKNVGLPAKKSSRLRANSEMGADMRSSVTWP